MMRNNFFSNIPKHKNELLLKKIAWYIYTMYDVEGDYCRWRYYDDTGFKRKFIYGFKESIEERYSQKIDEWEIHQ